jgi:hypothetical protein
MRAISRRLRHLEQTRAHGANQKLIRVVLSNVSKKLSLETSTVQIIQNGGGSSAEIVTLDGSRADITNEELDRFVQRFYDTACIKPGSQKERY